MTEGWPGTPEEALRLLVEGNRRFISGERLHPHQDADRRESSAEGGQRPFAVLFGCSDSRLAAEIIFDRGLGDLFVVRTAGHVFGPEVLGSIEYGVEILDVPLVAVLGHDSCGAVAAAMAAMTDGTMPPGFIRDVVERVLPSVLAVPDGDRGDGDRADADAVGTEHVRHTVDALARRSETIAQRIASGDCAVVGLSYRLIEGSVRVVAARGLPTAVEHAQP